MSTNKFLVQLKGISDDEGGTGSGGDLLQENKEMVYPRRGYYLVHVSCEVVVGMTWFWLYHLHTLEEDSEEARA